VQLRKLERAPAAIVALSLTIATSLMTTLSLPPTGAVQLIFLKDSHTHSKYLVDTGAALSLFPFRSTLPSSGPKLTNANGKTIVSWNLLKKHYIFKHNFLQANDTQAILGLDIPPPTWIQNRFLFRPLTQTCLPSTRCRTCFLSQARLTSFPSLPIYIFKHNFLQANDTQAILGLDIPPPTWIQNRFLFRPLTQTCLPSTRCRTCFLSQARLTSFPSLTPSNLYPQTPSSSLPKPPHPQKVSS
jgi:hypothetical protein